MMNAIQPTNLSEATFYPYGKIIKVPGKKMCKRKGSHWESWPCEAFFENLTGFCIGIVQIRGGALFVDEMERHLYQEELLIPGSSPILLPVSQSINPEDHNEKPTAEKVEIFVLMPGDVVVLKKGVWHGSCLALDTETHYFFGTGLKVKCSQKPEMLPLNKRVRISITEILK